MKHLVYDIHCLICGLIPNYIIHAVYATVNHFNVCTKPKMLQASRVVATIIFAIVIQYVNGNQRIVHISKLINDDNDFSTNDIDDPFCCMYGGCSCNSFYHALANLTSNVTINITADVILSSIVTVSDLENISIIGYNNPTVKCKNVGGMHFTFCHNCIIQGITWNGCGSNSTPSLKWSYSSNIKIQNCTFQYSVEQAVVLSEVSGDVSINNCRFVNNSYYRGHGMAIHYLSKNVVRYHQLLFTIDYCNFSYNQDAKSLVYIENKISEHNNSISFQSSIFHYNQGISIYVINQKVSLHGKHLLLNNIAENGAGIYISDHSYIIFGENSYVSFIQNMAYYKGGAILLRNYSILSFEHNSKVIFAKNNAISGGTIYIEANSIVTFKATCHVTFIGNSATQYGAAIYSSDNSHVAFTGNAKVIFNSNVVPRESSNGGIIYSVQYGNVTFKGNSVTVFDSNSADRGGGLYSEDNGHISFEGNSTVVFSNNSAQDGGALYSNNGNYIFFVGNSSAVFNWGEPERAPH